MKNPTASRMFLKVAKMVKNSHYHDNNAFRRELIGHVLEECVKRNIHTKCVCV